MKVIIDADGCPVVKSAVEISKSHDIEVLIRQVLSVYPIGP